MAQEVFPSKAINKINFKALAGKERNMKKYRRLISLILAIVMVSTCMAMSASAATTVVQPRASCTYCGSSMLRFEVEHYFEKRYVWQENITCTGYGFAHAHYKVPSKQYTYCGTCGQWLDTTDYGATYCPYRGYLS